MLLVWCSCALRVSAGNTILRGNVSDMDGASIALADIEVKDLKEQKNISVQTDDNGDYKVSLASGNYQIMVNKPGFCPQKTAPLDIEAETEIKVNVRMIVCSIVSKVVVDPDKKKSGMSSEYRAPFKEELIAIDSENDNTSSALIQYGEKLSSEKGTTFTAITMSRSKIYPVFFSYNTIQILTSSVFQESANIFTATGDVIFEDGTNRYEFKEVRFEFKDGKYKILNSK